MNGNLELVGRVERNLANLLISGTVLDHISLGQLGTFQNCSFRSIPVNLTLQDWNIILTRLEFGSVTESSNSLQDFPSGSVLVKSVSGLILGSIRLMDLVVKPHVSNSHSVLCECSGLIGADGGG